MGLAVDYRDNTMARSIGENIVRLREAAGMSGADLSRATGLVSTRISELENNRYRWPDAPTLMKLAKALNVGLDDLLEGVDEQYDQISGQSRIDREINLLNWESVQLRRLNDQMRAAGDTPELRKKLLSVINQSRAALREIEGEHSEHEAEPLDYDVSDYTPADIPVITEGEASPQGTLFWSDEGELAKDVERRISRPRDVTDPRAYGVLVRGDSMIPRYMPGETLIVSPNAVVKSGAFAYVELLTGERLIKRVHKQPDGWNLESLNAAYPPRFVRADEIGVMHKIMYSRSL